jgi:hypothetical protein
MFPLPNPPHKGEGKLKGREIHRKLTLNSSLYKWEGKLRGKKIHLELTLNSPPLVGGDRGGVERREKV